jgi:hypothetical protein
MQRFFAAQINTAPIWWPHTGHGQDAQTDAVGRVQTAVLVVQAVIHALLVLLANI